jgi:hypothetical protein
LLQNSPEIKEDGKQEVVNNALDNENVAEKV